MIYWELSFLVFSACYGNQLPKSTPKLNRENKCTLSSKDPDMREATTLPPVSPTQWYISRPCHTGGLWHPCPLPTLTTGGYIRMLTIPPWKLLCENFHCICWAALVFPKAINLWEDKRQKTNRNIQFIDHSLRQMQPVSQLLNSTPSLTAVGSWGRMAEI